MPTSETYQKMIGALDKKIERHQEALEALTEQREYFRKVIEAPTPSKPSK